MAIEVSSPAFEPGDAIPQKYTGEGQNISPPLQWSEPPEGTRELALICDDPDAPRPTPFVHWVVYKIPANLRNCPKRSCETEARYPTEHENSIPQRPLRCRVVLP